VQDLGPLLPQLNVPLALLVKPPLLVQMMLLTVLLVPMKDAALAQHPVMTNVLVVNLVTIPMAIRDAQNVSLAIPPLLVQTISVTVLLAVLVMPHVSNALTLALANVLLVMPTFIWRMVPVLLVLLVNTQQLLQLNALIVKMLDVVNVLVLVRINAVLARPIIIWPPTPVVNVIVVSTLLSIPRAKMIVSPVRMKTACLAVELAKENALHVPLVGLLQLKVFVWLVPILAALLVLLSVPLNAQLVMQTIIWIPRNVLIALMENTQLWTLMLVLIVKTVGIWNAKFAMELVQVNARNVSVATTWRTINVCNAKMLTVVFVKEQALNNARLVMMNSLLQMASVKVVSMIIVLLAPELVKNNVQHVKLAITWLMPRLVMIVTMKDAQIALLPEPLNVLLVKQTTIWTPTNVLPAVTESTQMLFQLNNQLAKTVMMIIVRLAVDLDLEYALLVTVDITKPLEINAKLVAIQTVIPVAQMELLALSAKMDTMLTQIPARNVTMLAAEFVVELALENAHLALPTFTCKALLVLPAVMLSIPQLVQVVLMPAKPVLLAVKDVLELNQLIVVPALPTIS
jgi:hypothetical protein